MIDKETTIQQIEEKFNAVMEAEAEFFKAMEEFRAIDAGWQPADEEEAKIMVPLAREIDGRINFAIRQILIRYGNMLFI